MLGWEDVFKIVAAFLASLGGGVVLIGAVVHKVGDVWAKRLIQTHKKALDEELESYKVKLKKSEFIFQKEFEATSELISLRSSIYPTILHPDMDWEEACDSIAQNFSKIAVKLKGYLSKHGAILTEDVINLISSCQAIAARNKFHKTPEISREANKAGNELTEKLEKAVILMRKQVLSQSKT